jgi:hypothetical protein
MSKCRSRSRDSQEMQWQNQSGSTGNANRPIQEQGWKPNHRLRDHTIGCAQGCTQFVLHHADVQAMILTAIMDVYHNTGSCIPPRVLSVPADACEVAQPPREQMGFTIHPLMSQAPAAVVRDQTRQDVRKFEFEPRACRRAAREFRDGFF